MLLQVAMFGFDKTNHTTLILRIRNIVFALFLTQFFLLGCNNTEKANFSILSNALRSTESRILDSYFNYIKNSSSAKIPFDTCIQKNELCKVVDFNKEVEDNPELLFFPATLWQLNILEGKEDWNQPVIDFSKEIQKATKKSNVLNGEHIQSMFLSAYEYNPTNELLGVIVNGLSDHISYLERERAKMKLEVVTVNNLELLLENKIMFFATKETGDPVFQSFALQNTSFLYEEAFKKDLRLMSVFSDGISEENLKLLQSEDFYKLALGICGFYDLYNETGIENYLKYCEGIAQVFISIFNNGEIDDKMVDKISLLSQSLVSLTLFDLASCQNDSYLETSEKIYRNVLQKLESLQPDEEEFNSNVVEQIGSFRLFYYLLEYEIKKQNES
nr:hypothetical protein [uncultured Draconibacterium sp.]